MAQKEPVQATKTEHYRSYTVKEHQRKMYDSDLAPRQAKIKTKFIQPGFNCL